MWAWTKATTLTLGVLALVLLAPLPAVVLNRWIPEVIGEFLFYLPQYVFPTAWGGALGYQAHRWWFVPVWVLAAFTYGWFARQWRPTIVLALAVPLVILVTILLHLGMSLLGFRFLLGTL